MASASRHKIEGQELSAPMILLRSLAMLLLIGLFLVAAELISPGIAVQGQAAVEPAKNGRAAAAASSPMQAVQPQPAQQRDLSEHIAPGFRAVTFGTKVSRAMEDLARRGAKVDLGWVGELKGKTVFKVLAENIEVLDAKINSSAPLPGLLGDQDLREGSVTVLVNKALAIKLHLAQQTGALSVSFRAARPLPVVSGEDQKALLEVYKSYQDLDSYRVEGYLSVKAADGPDEFWIMDSKGIRRLNNTAAFPRAQARVKPW
jgi:hypothetical protein